MGRPRKRRHTDEDATRPVSRRSKPSPTVNRQPTSPFMNMFEASSSSHQSPHHNQQLFAQPSLDFLDQSPGQDLPFLDLGSDYYNHVSSSAEMAMTYPALAPSCSDAGSLGSISASFDFNQSPVFDPSSYQSEDSNNPPSLYVGSHFSASPEAPASPPSDAAISGEYSAYQPGQPRKPAPTVSCGCISSLNFALESLSHLPQDVPTAMRVVRGASKVAQDVVSCVSCSGLNNPVTEPILMQSFQSFMILGALMPSACNAYAAIMEMVHNDVLAAKRENRTLFFSLRDLGGYYDAINPDDDLYAGHDMHSFDNQFLSPDVWRGVVCSILRLDVYGNPRNQGYRRRKSLREVLAVLEERSNERHAEMDRLNASGQMPKHTGYLFSHGEYQPTRKEDRHCLRVLHIARVALNNLVIA